MSLYLVFVSLVTKIREARNQPPLFTFRRARPRAGAAEREKRGVFITSLPRTALRLSGATLSSSPGLRFGSLRSHVAEQSQAQRRRSRGAAIGRAEMPPLAGAGRRNKTHETQESMDKSKAPAAARCSAVVRRRDAHGFKFQVFSGHNVRTDSDGRRCHCAGKFTALQWSKSFASCDEISRSAAVPAAASDVWLEARDCSHPARLPTLLRPGTGALRSVAASPRCEIREFHEKIPAPFVARLP